MAEGSGNANPYAAGKNVYRGGSNVATMGPVDPSGYVNRELNNRRSGMAQQMLQKMGPQQQPGQAPQNTMMGAIDPKHVSLLAVKMMGGQ